RHEVQHDLLESRTLGRDQRALLRLELEVTAWPEQRSEDRLERLDDDRRVDPCFAEGARPREIEQLRDDACPALALFDDLAEQRAASLVGALGRGLLADRDDALEDRVEVMRDPCAHADESLVLA